MATVIMFYLCKGTGGIGPLVKFRRGRRKIGTTKRKKKSYLKSEVTNRVSAVFATKIHNYLYKNQNMNALCRIMS